MKKWLIGMFVLALSLGFSGIVSARSESTPCNASPLNGYYSKCPITLHVGDDKPGGLDDYDFVWETTWLANDYNTAYFKVGTFKATGVESGNQDYIYSHKFTHAGGTNFYNSYCTGKKVYNMNCNLDYLTYLDEKSSSNSVDGNVVIYDPETRIYHVATVYFKSN